MMQFRTICLSAHLDSFCRKLDELCGLEFVYAVTPGEMRQSIGWRKEAEYRNGPITPENTERAKSCELLYDMLREIDLFEARAKKGLKTVYAGERWLKPIPLHGMKVKALGEGEGWRIPGVLRLLVPGYWRMARRFVKLMDDPNFYVFAIGVPAVRDFVRMYRLFHGDWRSLFREPKIGIERKLGGAVEGFPRLRLWAYFVAPSNVKPQTSNVKPQTSNLKRQTSNLKRQTSNVKPQTSNLKPQTSNVLRVLWVGRMLDWKRVDTLIKAFKRVAKRRSAALVLVGEGPERRRLETLAGTDWIGCSRTVAASATGAVTVSASRGGRDGTVTASASRGGRDGTVEGCGFPEWQEGKIVFSDYVRNEVVRELMRRADVYVMPSNGEEGWGAAVSEALSEGCPVISTREAGSAATLLPDGSLFHSGAVAELADRLLRFKGEPVGYDAADWSGEAAAKKLMEIVAEGRAKSEV